MPSLLIAKPSTSTDTDVTVTVNVSVVVSTLPFAVPPLSVTGTNYCCTNGVSYWGIPQ